MTALLLIGGAVLGVVVTVAVCVIWVLREFAKRMM